MTSGFDRAPVVVAIGLLAAIIAGAAATVNPKIALVVALVLLALALAALARRAILPWAAFVLVAMAGVTLPGLRIPLGDAGAALALVLCIGQRPPEPTRLPQAMKVLLGLLVLGTAAAAAVDAPPASGAAKRVVHIALFALLVAALASGRIRQFNLVRGIVIGLSLGLLSGLAGLAGVSSLNHYAHRLTGFFGDPNVASLVTVCLGMVVLHYMKGRQHRQLVMGLMIVIVALTLSRTGALALVLALLWLLLVHRLPRSVGVGLIVVAIITALLLPANLQTFGPFQIHVSSDHLRALIDQASFTDLRQHFLTGTGPGTAYITIVNGEQFFFHNSFYAIVAELGLFGAVPYLFLAVFTATKLFATRPRSPELEAAFLGIMVMALTLGEVLLTLTAAVVIGAAWRHILLSARLREPRMANILEPV